MCEYCEEDAIEKLLSCKNEIMGIDFEFAVDISNEELQLYSKTEYDVAIVDTFKLNYCPVCGRKLKEGVVDD